MRNKIKETAIADHFWPPQCIGLIVEVFVHMFTCGLLLDEKEAKHRKGVVETKRTKFCKNCDKTDSVRGVIKINASWNLVFV